MSAPPGASGKGSLMCQPSITGTTQSCESATPVESSTSRRGKLMTVLVNGTATRAPELAPERQKFETDWTRGPKGYMLSVGPDTALLSGPTNSSAHVGAPNIPA